MTGFSREWTQIGARLEAGRPLERATTGEGKQWSRLGCGSWGWKEADIQEKFKVDLLS